MLAIKETAQSAFERLGIKNLRDLLFYSPVFYTISDVLVMTATPIPRSLTLTMFGDMTILQIKNKPKNRLPVITSIFLQLRKLKLFNH